MYRVDIEVVRLLLHREITIIPRKNILALGLPLKHFNPRFQDVILCRLTNRFVFNDRFPLLAPLPSLIQLQLLPNILQVIVSDILDTPELLIGCWHSVISGVTQSLGMLGASQR